MNNIPVNQPLLNGNEEKYLIECIRTGWISSEGPFIKKFEDNFSARVQRNYGIAVSNGSVALDIAIKALGIGETDEIILPTFTIISCAASIVRSGATPVLVDSDSKTWNIDINQIESKITSKTKAIMVVHIYGLPVDMNRIVELARKYNLKIIEDAAEMHGQTYYNLPCGSFGDISIFSFYPNKHITTGEGGMLVTNDNELHLKCKSLRNLCFNDERRFVHHELGWNFRMTNLQAALGVAQLERLDEFVIKKRKIGEIYNNRFKNIKGLKLPLEQTEYAKNIYWVYAIVISEEIQMNAIEMMSLLAKKGIGTRPFFYPMHLQPVFINMGLFKNQNYPVSEYISDKGFYLPSGLAITEDEIHQSADAVIEILESFK
jgi:perosamine synthetase